MIIKVYFLRVYYFIQTVVIKTKLKGLSILASHESSDYFYAASSVYHRAHSGLCSSYTSMSTKVHTLLFRVLVLNKASQWPYLLLQ